MPIGKTNVCRKRANLTLSVLYLNGISKKIARGSLSCGCFWVNEMEPVTVVRDWINRQVLAEKISLRNEQRIILAPTVGYPK
jgi:hypothetical protein